MWRRGLLVLVCGAIVWAHAAPAQQLAVPVVGFLRSAPAAPFAHIVAAFRRGLAEAELVINARTAKGLELDIPPSSLLRADEVME